MKGESNAFLIYQDDNGVSNVNVRFEGEDVWLAAEQLAELFQTTQQNISLHVQNIYAEGEIDENRTHKKYLLVRNEGNRSVKRNILHYNLDMILAIGMRIRSDVATRFRQWAIRHLHEFTAPGWVRDENGALRRETIHRMGRRLPDFDYSSRRIYEITVVLEERRAVLGRLVKLSAGLSDLGPDGGGCELGQGWAVEPSEWGEVVLNCWREIEARWPQVSLIEAQLMPDHFHGVLFVKEALPKGKSLGSIIGGFKAGCTKGWREIAAALSGAGPDGSARSPTGGRVPHWAEGYVDTILFGRGQLEKMVNYLRDNPRRLGVKREHPELFKVARDLEVSLGPAGIGHFAAIGNHFLLARHELRQVQVSRRFFAYRRDARGKILRGEPPAVSTAEFAAKLADALAAAKRGAVLVSPCVSEGEREIGRQVFAAGGRVITLQNKGFSPLYKPGGKLFETCANGNLLMLAPAAWPYQVNEKPMTRFDATAMNRLAQWIAGEGAAEIDYKGMRPDNIDELARAAAKVKTTIHV